MDSSLEFALSCITKVHGSQPLKVLILGDPRAELCTSMSALGHEVWCCPDDQRTPRGDHVREVASSLDDLHLSSQQWDVVVAVAGFQRIQAVRTQHALSEVLFHLADHAQHVLLEAPRNKLAPDLHDLGPYRLDLIADAFSYLSEIPTFSQIPGRQDRPLIHASNAGLMVDSTWIPGNYLTRLDERSRSGHTYQRTFRYADSIVKVVAASPDYAERNEVALEAGFLQGANDELIERLALPRIDHVHQGRAVTTLIRSAVSGVALLHDAAQNGFAQFDAVIDVACLWANNQLFHNDLRPWNLLWDGHNMHLIDYADAGMHDLDVQDLPQILSLAATLAAMATPDIRWGEFFLADALEALDEVVNVRDPGWYTEPWLTLPTRAREIKQTLNELVQPNTREIIAAVLQTVPLRENTISGFRPEVL